MQCVQFSSFELVTTLCKSQKRKHKVIHTKDTLLFPQHFCRNFMAYFRLQLLSQEPHNFLSNAVATEKYLAKEFLLWHQNIGEIKGLFTRESDFALG